MAALTAIVIDDDHSTVLVFSEYLQIKGIKVVGKGYDGMDAIKLYEKLKPDMVFLDVMMDRYDGFYALEKIKEMQPSAVVIMVTADITSETDKRLSKLNASSVIYKPYNIDTVMETVNKLFSG